MSGASLEGLELKDVIGWLDLLCLDSIECDLT